MKIVKPFGTLPPFQRSETNENFTPYVCMKNLFNNDEVDKIRALWDEERSKDGQLGSKKVDENIRKSKVQFLNEVENGWIYDKLTMAIFLTNASKYMYDITGFHGNLQLTSYTDGGFYGWHMDCGSGKTSVRKLSITVQLSDSDEYEGGELQFLRHGKESSVAKEKGMAVIFPSFVAHRVEPVTSGRRMSIVGWIAGPPYR